MKTLQLTPASLSAPSIENVVETPSRLSVLWHDCLIRDHNWCVATRVFNWTEALERLRQDSPNAKDDDCQPLVFAPGQLALLEVAHIIPHSIMSATSTVGGELQLVCAPFYMLCSKSMFSNYFLIPIMIPILILILLSE